MAYSTNQVNKFVFIPLQNSEGMETYVDLSTVTKASFAHMSCICPLTLGIVEFTEHFSPEKSLIFSLYTPNKESKIPHQIHFNMNVNSTQEIIKEYQRINKLLKPFNVGFTNGFVDYEEDGELWNGNIEQWDASNMELWFFDPAVEVYCNQGVIKKLFTYGENWETAITRFSERVHTEVGEGFTFGDLMGFTFEPMESFNLKRISAFANFADGFSNDQMFGVGYPYTDFPAKLSNIDEIHVNIPMEDWPSYVAFALECDYQGTGEDTQKSHMVYQGFMPKESWETLYAELMSKNIPITLTGLDIPSQDV